MAKGEYFNLNCTPPPYGTDNTADNYSCINYNLCNFLYNGEKCNIVYFPNRPTMVTNDDYSLSFTFPIAATTEVFSSNWYTCEGWTNPAYGSTVPIPDLSEVVIQIYAATGSGTEFVVTQNTVISLTDPGDLALTGSNWEYTTDPCQCTGYGEYRIAVALKWDYASSPVVVNDFGCYSDTYYSAAFNGRPPIGLEIALEGYGTGGQFTAGGTLTPYNTGAGCTLLPDPNQTGKKGPKRNRIR